ncbi:unnamed protein product [Bursaphelenchus okinawaensis]|uniref:BPTI/Kunitz inhibitor domain-containing protein n=1 Tax=Bursaphelenchus okinawaensis TaxID=465554 RepID=A0A811LKE6_9BILA|nr:unnamed protein product [Bursaphelenchus okinawaensis]CAG9127484.1 unnamed protein product [Bursaphelenchus okinawaensis]
MNRCVPNTRYRWTYRPQPINIHIPLVSRPNPNIPLKPMPSPQPIVPLTRGTLSPATYPTTTTTQTTTTTTPPTPPPLISTTPELPTPPPYTGTYAPRIEVTTVFMRPSKKPEVEGLPFIPDSADKQNPCPNGRPLTNEYNAPMTCNFMVKPNGGCPEDYWCHTGASFAATTCCPIIRFEDRCKMPKVNGEGEDLIPRWYYDHLDGVCKRFLYKGLKGNANNFITNVQCSEACEGSQENLRATGFVNPCAVGTPAKLRDGSVQTCTPTDETHSVCPTGYFCHIGDTKNVCCEKTSNTDRCHLPLATGTGSAELRRFYYNPIAKRCIEFLYKGIAGNENNFLTYNDCKKQCLRFNNPCPSSFDHGERKECSPLSNLCEKGEWCHIGSNAETTACCPGAIADPCKLPLDHGEGSETITRWYSDPSDKSCNNECKPFVYRGVKGNQNNFVTKEACEEKCKTECTNPCSSGDLLLSSVDGKPRQCSPTDLCPNGYWCHVGLVPDTTVCCSAVKQPCDLPMVEGFGEAMLTRWYYNKRTRQCISFIYRGIGGNQNNFLTQDDCRAACPAFDNPCGTGQPLLVNHKPKICSPNQRCPGTHYCHIGESSLNYCCPKNGNPCDQPLAVGQGQANFKRFFYDQETRQCQEFTYHGSKGNANNYLTLEDCRIVCQASENPCPEGDPLQDPISREPLICGGPQECPSGFWCHVGGSPNTTNCCPGSRKPCDLETNEGQGTLRLERWTFDGTAQMCRRFYYKGTKGNSNNFLSRDACRQACPEANPCLTGEPLLNSTGNRLTCEPTEKFTGCPASHFCHPGSNTDSQVCCPRGEVDICEQGVQEGHGKESLRRFYFDPSESVCREFTFRGGKGNENNFVSKSACEDVCPAHRSYCPHGQPQTDPHSKKPIPCGILKSCSIGFVCHMSVEYRVSVCCENPANFCTAPRDPGHCNGTEIRYGYNALTDTCVEYKYSGCGGTLNNFKTMEQCTQICCKEYRH